MQAEQTKYQLQLPVFEGPIELLLRLIEERKLSINEVSLAQVTDEYIKKIDELLADKEKEVMEV